MSFEEMYFQKQLEAGKVDAKDIMAYYKGRCKSLEERCETLETKLAEAQTKLKEFESHKCKCKEKEEEPTEENTKEVPWEDVKEIHFSGKEAENLIEKLLSYPSKYSIHRYL